MYQYSSQYYASELKNDLNPIEFIKAGPSPRLRQAFEELAHRLVVETV